MQKEPDWNEVVKYFRGSELQNYFTRVVEDKLKTVVKPQYVDQIPRSVKGKVGAIVRERDQKGIAEEIIKTMDLVDLQDRNIEELSGGELQRFAIACAVIRQADVYMFDEPSSFLDVKQRLTAAKAIRSALRHDSYVVVVEHDLSVLDYMSDYVNVLYGVAGAYGVVTLPFGVREGNNRTRLS